MPIVSRYTQSQSQQVILVSFDSWVQAIACPEVVKYVAGKAKVFCLCAANDALLGQMVLKPSFLVILLAGIEITVPYQSAHM